MGPTVVKLGGSVLTVKDSRTPRIRRDVIERLGHEVAAAPDGLVVVHGAGSFGHPAAKRHGLSRTPREVDDDAAEEVRGSVRRLHRRVTEALSAAGLEPVTLETTRFVRMDGGRLDQLDTTAARDALAAGAVPVAFGDLVPDASGGWVVVSGDDLAVELARRLGATRLLMVTDVDGLYTRPPGTPGAVLVEALPDGAGEGVVAPETDVTGGLSRKIELLRGLPVTCTVGIVNGLAQGRVREALTARTIGTWRAATE